jgi:hypothetical protein
VKKSPIKELILQYIVVLEKVVSTMIFQKMRMIPSNYWQDIGVTLLFTLLVAVVSWPLLSNINNANTGYDPDVFINPRAD